MIFFFNDTATTEIYTLSLHDALPIFADQFLDFPYELVEGQGGGRRRVDLDDGLLAGGGLADGDEARDGRVEDELLREDRKSTRLNSSHANISYAVFCLQKKKHINLAV